jgi:adenosylcobyric acid synthase
VVPVRIWEQDSAADYHGRRVEELMPVIRESYAHLAAHHSVLILEGAGSPAEINLKQHDIANMRIAEMADARCLLVGVLDPHERDRIAGFAINKFRGDLALLSPGLRTMESGSASRVLACCSIFPGLLSTRKTGHFASPIRLSFTIQFH